jgi:uncharacterized LabA/DUF88 family protein
VSKNVAVFVDVANIFYAAKAAGVDIDYVTLLRSASAGRDLVRAYAYTGLDPDNENQRNFHSFLARNGYRVVSKDIRKYGDGKVKANLDIELVVDMLKTARNLDIAIVVSGDGDFAPAIRAVQEMGVRVEVISFRGNTSSDLIDVADQFTDIIHLAKVEKASSRSGRRVAEDDEDLSMTEVPDKQTEGTGSRGRGRGRERSRSREAEPAARAPRSSRSRPAEPAAAALTSSGAPLVVLPGEKLSRVGAGDVPAALVPGDDEVAEGGAVAALTGRTDAVDEAAETGEHRRRRRRGGRGRGRGRGRGEAPEGEPPRVEPVGGPREPRAVAQSVPLDVEPEEFVEAPRGPRPTPFGSVWDSQLGVPSQTASTSLPLAPIGDDEDFEEPEIPEYLIAERRNRGRTGGGGGGGVGRGGRGNRAGYAAAVDRERYGRGGGGGINRYPDVSARERPPRDTGFQRQERPDRQPRPAGPRPGGGGGSEPWSEVPPELEAMLRAQLSTRPRSATPAEAPVEPVTESRVAEAADVGSADTTAPKRRTPRRTAATAGTTDTAGEGAEATAPKRRTTRRTAATSAGDADATTTSGPKRRTTARKPAAKSPTKSAAAGESPAGATPKPRATRRKASTDTPSAAPAETPDTPAT